MATRLVASSVRIVSRTFLQRTPRTIINPFKNSNFNHGKRNFSTSAGPSEADGSKHAWKWLSIATATTLGFTLSQRISADAPKPDETKKVAVERNVPASPNKIQLSNLPDKISIYGKEFKKGFKSDTYEETTYFPEGQSIEKFEEMIFTAVIKQPLSEVYDSLSSSAANILEQSDNEILFSGKSSKLENGVCIIGRLLSNPDNKKSTIFISYYCNGSPEDIENLGDDFVIEWADILKEFEIKS